MIKKHFPFLFIVIVWLIFAKPFFINHQIPYPADYQVNHSDLWSSYSSFWGVVKNPAQPDVISQIFPWKHLVIDSWKNGQVPLWNPYILSGNPLLANYQSGVFSSINILFFLFNFKIAWSMAVLIQPLLAGIFMYLFTRSLKLGKFSSLISAVSFMFCGFITTWMSYTTLSLAISFLPLGLFAIEEYSQTKLKRFLFLLFITFPLSLFSGHFQTSLYFVLYVLAYIAFKFFETRNKKDLINYLTFSFLGIAFSSIQILPSIELYLQAVRSDIFQKISPLQLTHLTTILAPDFYGNPVTRNDIFGNYAEQSSFLGVIPFLLSIFAFFSKSKKVTFFFIMAVVSLLLCINSPLVDLFISLKIPVLSTASLSRILVLFSFSAAVLSGYGLEKLENHLKNEEYKHIRIWIGVCLLIFVLLFANTLHQPFALKNSILPLLMFFGLTVSLAVSVFRKNLLTLTLIILVLLTSFDMLRFATKWQSFTPPDLVFPTTPVISKLVTLDNTYRTYGPLGQEGNDYYKIPGTDGYDPLYINRYGQFMESLNDGKIKSSGRVGTTLPTHAKYLPNVIDLLGIKYFLIKPRDLNKPWVMPIKKYPADKFSLIYKEKGFLIYENNNVYPRAFLVGSFEVIKNDQKIINRILSPSANLRTEAVVEKNIQLNKNKYLSGTAVITKYSPNEIDIKTDGNKDSLLVLTDNYYPGWRATVNGKPTEVLRTDYTFRAIVVPKGNKDIKFYYDSDSFKYGLYITLISGLTIFILLARPWYTKKRERD